MHAKAALAILLRAGGECADAELSNALDALDEISQSGDVQLASASAGARVFVLNNLALSAMHEGQASEALQLFRDALAALPPPL